MILKSFFSKTIFVLVFFMFFSLHIYANEQSKVSIVLNGTQVDNLIISPKIIDENVLVSTIDIKNLLDVGIDSNITNNLVNITNNQDSLILEINSNLANFNGEDILLDSAPMLINDFIMLPITFIAEALGFETLWNESLNELHINNLLENTAVSRQTDSTSYPEKTVTNISVPNQLEPHTFVIETSSEIEEFNYFELDNGRIVIDIHDTTIDLEGTQNIIENSPNVSLIRWSETEVDGNEVARIVIELSLLSSIYDIYISEDKRSINVHFKENLVNISSNFSQRVDSINIAGTRPPDINVSNIYGNNNLIIDVYNGKLNNLEQPVITGNFIKDYSVTQLDNNIVRINIMLEHPVSYSLSYYNNTVSVIIAEPTFNNITFNPDNNTIILTQSESSPIKINDITHNYDDFHSGYILTLPGDYSDFFGDGVIEVYNEFINTIGIVTESGNTNIVIDQNRIIALDIRERGEEIFINIIPPKDKYDKIVILDPGHGGHDPGAHHFDVMEKDLNLIISNMAKELLKQDENIKVYATRSTDVFVPLTKRSELANEAADLFVSIHLNAIGEGHNVTRGTETYYLVNDTDENFDITREEVATIFQTNLVKGLGTRDRGIKTANFSVLRNTNIPSVLLELGFLTNKEENDMFSDPIIQQKVAEIIYQSIIEIFEIYTPVRQ